MDNPIVKSKLNIAIRTLLSNDEYLLRKDIKEESIAHKLAEYLQPLFQKYNVDCEYNGDVDRGNERKVVLILTERLIELGRIKPGETDKKTVDKFVYPDIIIHKRGTNKKNLCIIEVKKTTNATDVEWDFEKLEAYTKNLLGNNLRYKLGVSIKFNAGIPYQKGGTICFFENGDQTNSTEL